MATATAAAAPPSNVLVVAWDFSNFCQAALDSALECARPGDKVLCVCCVPHPVTLLNVADGATQFSATAAAERAEEDFKRDCNLMKAGLDQLRTRMKAKIPDKVLDSSCSAAA